MENNPAVHAWQDAQASCHCAARTVVSNVFL
jgi:hypothetical protein